MRPTGSNSNGCGMRRRCAERQFRRVDPDNRVVTAELERRWEAALRELSAAKTT